MFPRSLMHECIMALTHNGSFISDFMTTARTTAKATVDNTQVKQAPLYTTSMIIALELLVVEHS